MLTKEAGKLLQFSDNVIYVVDNHFGGGARGGSFTARKPHLQD